MICSAIRILFTFLINGSLIQDGPLKRRKKQDNLRPHGNAIPIIRISILESSRRINNELCHNNSRDVTRIFNAPILVLFGGFYGEFDGPTRFICIPAKERIDRSKYGMIYVPVFMPLIKSSRVLLPRNDRFLKMPLLWLHTDKSHLFNISIRKTMGIEYVSCILITYVCTLKDPFQTFVKFV